MRWIDPGVLLEDGVGIARFESDFGAADTGAGGIADEHGPAGATAVTKGAVEFGDELGVNDDVTDIEVIAWRRLHDVMECHGVRPEVLGKGALDHLERVAELTRALSGCPSLDHRPVDVGERELLSRFTRVTWAPRPRQKASAAGTASKVDHVSRDLPSVRVSSQIRAISREPMPTRRRSRLTSTSHSITRSSPAEFDQQ
jgi:hypothetical protein